MPTLLSDRWPDADQHVTATKIRDMIGSRGRRETVRCLNCSGFIFRIIETATYKAMQCLGCSFHNGIEPGRPSLCRTVEWEASPTQDLPPGTPRI